MTDSGASWETGQWVDMVVTCGGSTMTVASNTATVLTGGAWAGGEPPDVSAYTIESKAIIPTTGTINLNFGTSDLISRVDAVMQGWVGVETQPNTGQIGLLSTALRSDSVSFRRYVRIGDTGGTDRKVRVYNTAETELCVSTSEVPTSGLIHVAVAWNFSCMGESDSALIQLFMGGVEEAQFAYTGSVGSLLGTGTAQAFGEWINTGTSRGADLFGEDLTFRVLSIGDSGFRPMYDLFPRIRLIGSASMPPTMDSSHNAAAAKTHDQWTVTGGSSPNLAFSTVDEYPNDDTTSSVNAAAVNLKQSFQFLAANPLVSTDTVEAIGFRFNIAIGAGKVFGSFLLCDTDDTETLQTLPNPGITLLGAATDHATGVYGLVRPDGGTWVVSDFDQATYASGVAEAVTATTMTDNEATWIINQWEGYLVTIGASSIRCISNTATILTMAGTGWTGGTPAPGAYTLTASKLHFGFQAPSSGSIFSTCTNLTGPEIYHWNATDAEYPDLKPPFLQYTSLWGRG
jgi:hypothetical protein